MEYLKRLLTGEISRIAKEKEIIKHTTVLEKIAGKIEAIDVNKIGKTNIMNLNEAAKELENLSKKTSGSKATQLKNIAKILEEKAKEIESARKVKDVVTEVVDESIALVGVKTSIRTFSPELNSKMDNLVRGKVIKSARSSGMDIAGKIAESAGKAAKYEGKAVNETHVTLAVELIGKRFGILVKPQK